MKYRFAIHYALVGALFGLVFPIFGTVVETVKYALPLTIVNFLQMQSQNPLLWIIDTTPIFLGIFAGFAGIRQDRLTRQYQDLEAEVLARCKADDELEIFKNNLYQEVKEHTFSLERKVIQLEVSTEIACEISTIRELDILLSEVTFLISERFNFYHIGIFLLDDSGSFAVLRATNSEGGQIMLAREHKLKIGGDSIIGFVTNHQVHHTAQFVGSDAVHFDNLDLPDTRSELALPLLVGGKLLGVLDVHSKRESAFDIDDISVLKILANLVAVAIENASLFSEHQNTLKLAHREYSELSQQAWQELLQQSELGYISSDTIGLQPIENEWSPMMRETAESGIITQIHDETIHIPIVLRGITLGVVRLRRREGKGAWNNEEIDLVNTLVDQLKNALEAARLYSDTQIQAERERITHEITDKLHRSLDIDTLMQTLLQEITTALGTSDAFVQLSTEDDSLVFNKSE